MKTIEKQIRESAAKLLESGGVDLVIGYENGSLPLRTRPCFVRSPASAETLIWNSFCTNNLAVYLPKQLERRESRPTIGIVAKGCDARSVIGLLKESQIPRDSVVIIGVPCSGMADPEKIDRELDGVRVTGVGEPSNLALTVIDENGDTRELSSERVLCDSCLECEYPSTAGADIVIDGKPKDPGETAADEIPAEERWEHFSREVSKCIRCNACRQACPNCFCKVCFADQTKPRWLGAGTDLSDIMAFHIIRVFHQAGRCVGCDACTRACPMGVDLRQFGVRLGEDVKELFGYVPGLSMEEPPPLCTFRMDDEQSFITEP